ncbi:hypothetical protein CC2G_011138 [Coprinopsis cinerea AmutBmut pab1-1]|nr:hypothetical protein CC2G_011138 [Coprinopsis cinerea AmutBmut pab1-1]
MPTDSESSTSEFEELERNIQTVTTLLHKGKYCGAEVGIHVGNPDIPPVLRHLSNLLTCGSPADRDAKQVVAVTGTFLPEDPQTPSAILVAQNPRVNSTEPGSRIVVSVAKPTAAQQDNMVDPSDSDDTPSLPSQFHALCNAFKTMGAFDQICLFALQRSIYKFLDRFLYYPRIFNGRTGEEFWEPLSEWDPLSDEIKTPRTVALTSLTPEDEFLLKDVPQNEKAWELSSASVKSFVLLVHAQLCKIDRHCRVLEGKIPFGASLHADAATCMDQINASCIVLLELHRHKLLETLLVGTSLAKLLNTEFAGRGGAVQGETPAMRLYGFIKKILAWHWAAYELYYGKHSVFPGSYETGFVTASYRKHDLLPLYDVQHRLDGNELGELEDVVMSDPNWDEAEVDLQTSQRLDALQQRARRGKHERFKTQALEHLYRQLGSRTRFTGTLHAETILMAVAKYQAQAHGERITYGADIDDESLKNLCALLPGSEAPCAIGVGKKCCYCCWQLGERIGGVKLPGTHGILFPWTPPPIGVDIAQLRDLEQHLWKNLGDLCTRPLSRRPRLVRRQSSGESMADDTTLAPQVQPPPAIRSDSPEQMPQMELPDLQLRRPTKGRKQRN